MSIFPIRALTEKVLINMPKAIFPPSKNTYISQYYPLQNFNRSVSLFAGQFKQSGDAYRSLLKFDINNISTDGYAVADQFIYQDFDADRVFLILDYIFVAIVTLEGLGFCKTIFHTANITCGS